MLSADAEDTAAVMMTLTLSPLQDDITLMVRIQMCDVLLTVIMSCRYLAQRSDRKEQSVTPLLVRREDQFTEVVYEDCIYHG